MKKKNGFLYIILALIILLGAYLLVNNYKNRQTVKTNIVAEANWFGSYSGTLPCASCEGVKTKLTLNPNGTYLLNEEYITNKEGQKLFEEKGVFAWDEENISKITLFPENKDSIQRMYLVGEGFLQALDINGNKIEGELADSYILRR